MMLTLDDLRRRARHRAVTFVSTRPWLYYGLRRTTGMLDELCIAADTELARSARLRAMLDAATVLHRNVIEQHERRR